MKTTTERLSYWKGHLLDAQGIVAEAKKRYEEAGEHYEAMLKTLTKAKKHINKLEGKILSIMILFAVGFAHGCGTIKG